MNREFLRRHKIAGFSLIELLVAMVVGLIVIGGTASVYLVSKRSYVEVERMARMTQNGRFAIQMISEAIVNAGFFGEASPTDIRTDTNLTAIAGTDCSGTAAAFDVEHYMIAAVSDVNGDAFGCVTDALPGTSVILLKSVRPMKISDSDNDNVVDDPEAITGTNTYIMANNRMGIIFDGADTPPTINNFGGDIPGGSAWIYQVQAYYVRDTGQLSQRALVWNDKASSMVFVTENLIDGVENISFLFGLDSNADGEIDIYRTAASINPLDWVNIGAIQISILVRSDTTDPQHNDTKVYNLAGVAPIGPLNDNFHRMVMQSTVSLRNPNFVIRGNL